MESAAQILGILGNLGPTGILAVIVYLFLKERRSVARSASNGGTGTIVAPVVKAIDRLSTSIEVRDAVTSVKLDHLHEDTASIHSRLDNIHASVERIAK